MNRTIGTAVYGLRAPIIKQGDNLTQIVTDVVLNCGINLKDKDIIAMTESIVARAQGNYVSVDTIAKDIKRLSKNADYIVVANPIYSRNRFAMILKSIARAAGKKVFIVMPPIDEVGNVVRNHPFTKMNYDDYYKSIVEAEGKAVEILESWDGRKFNSTPHCFIASDIHTRNKTKAHFKTFYPNSIVLDLTDICHDKCEYGLLGSNKSNEEQLKLFPGKMFSDNLIYSIQATIKQKTGKNVEAMIFGDGCFKDPVGGIWELADPVVSPAYTNGLEGTPNEIKLKNFADDKYKDLKGKELEEAIKKEITSKNSNLKGSMASQGTTPRRYTDLIGSLCDLTSGSGDKGTPIILLQGYFDNYTR